jgi:hypothetical protein
LQLGSVICECFVILKSIPRAYVPKASRVRDLHSRLHPHNLKFTVPSRKVPADVIFINDVHSSRRLIMALPTSRRFITQLLDSLPSSANNTDAPATVNPLSAVPEAAKKQLLSLQVLFPNEFLPALDLLDRGLVTRLKIHDDSAEHTASALKDTSEAAARNQDNHQDETMANTMAALENYTHHDIASAQDQSAKSPLQPSTSTYYVRSAQSHPSRYASSYDTTTSYEVRLLGWNCSCPAFAFTAFPSVHPEPEIPVYNHTTAREGMEGSKWWFGGVSLGDDIPPVCKHLLACVLVEKCAGLFGGYVEERECCVEEAAGWAAGWGD